MPGCSLWSYLQCKETKFSPDLRAQGPRLHGHTGSSQPGVFIGFLERVCSVICLQAEPDQGREEQTEIHEEHGQLPTSDIYPLSSLTGSFLHEASPII
jgi:hypothetical protein